MFAVSVNFIVASFPAVQYELNLMNKIRFKRYGLSKSLQLLHHIVHWIGHIKCQDQCGVLFICSAVGIRSGQCSFAAPRRH